MNHQKLRHWALALGGVTLIAAAPGVRAVQGSGDPTQKQTASLEAKKFATEALALAYLDTGDFYAKTLSSVFPNGSKLQVYPGEYNMAGSKNGIAPSVIMRAAYTASYVYMKIQWTDPTASNDQIRRRFLFEGPTDTTGTVPGWSSQKNCDKVSLAFDIDGAADATGTFATKGCTVGCHGTMNPTIGKMDIWNWKASTSNPIGYMNDMWAGPAGLAQDGGLPIEVRNFKVAGQIAKGPRYVRNPALPIQTVTLPNVAEGTVNLDPKVFLLKTNMMLLAGDADLGKTVYTTKCTTCHGSMSSWKTKFASRGYSQTDAQIKAFLIGNSHPGRVVATALTAAETANVIALFRGLGGIPGHYLQTPTSSAASIPIWNSKTVYSAGKYTVILRRRLKTTYVDDVQFDLTKAVNYPFSIAIMDRDAKNHAGSAFQLLKFLP